MHYDGHAYATAVLQISALDDFRGGAKQTKFSHFLKVNFSSFSIFSFEQFLLCQLSLILYSDV